MAASDEPMYFKGAERAEKVAVFLEKGYEEKSKLQKFTYFAGDDLPPVYVMTDTDSRDVMKNVLAISPDIDKNRLSFPVLAKARNRKSREIYLHSDMTEFRYAVKNDGSRSKQNENYRVQFHSTEELSRILDELIALYRNEL